MTEKEKKREGNCFQRGPFKLENIIKYFAQLSFGFSQHLRFVVEKPDYSKILTGG